MKRPKNGHFGFENAHGSFRKYFYLIDSESCTMDSGIIHFDIFYNTFMSLKYQKGLKMATLSLKMAIFLFENGH